MENSKTKIEEVLKAIYWSKFTSKQTRVVEEILNDNDLDAMSKANEICDFLEIEKRGNRQNIYTLLI